MNQNNEGYKFVTSVSLYKTSLIKKKGAYHSFYLKTKKQTTLVTFTVKPLFPC